MFSAGLQNNSSIWPATASLAHIAASDERSELEIFLCLYIYYYFRFNPVKADTSVTLYWIRSNRDGSDNAAIESTSLDPNYRWTIQLFLLPWSCVHVSCCIRISDAWFCLLLFHPSVRVYKTLPLIHISQDQNWLTGHWTQSLAKLQLVTLETFYHQSRCLLGWSSSG